MGNTFPGALPQAGIRTGHWPSLQWNTPPKRLDSVSCSVPYEWRMSEINEPNVVRIARDGEELGAWTGLEIRQFVASGALLTSDLASEDGTSWTQLLPSPKRRYNHFDWGGEDDQLWYFIRDGFIHGPRLIEEIGALIDADYLTMETLVSSLGMESWLSVGDLFQMAQSEQSSPQSTEHLDAAKQHLMSGNLLSAAFNFGVHVVGALPADPSNERPKLP